MTLHNLVLHLIVWAYLGLSACKIFCFFRHLGLSRVLVALKFGTLSSIHTASVILLLIAMVHLFQCRFLGFCLKQAVHISSFSPKHESPTRSGWLQGFDDLAPLQHCKCFRWPANEYAFSSWRFTISLLTLLIKHGLTRAFSRGIYSIFLFIRLRFIWFFGSFDPYWRSRPVPMHLYGVKLYLFRSKYLPLPDNLNLTSHHSPAWHLCWPQWQPLSWQYLSWQSLGDSECIERTSSIENVNFPACHGKIFKQ